MNPNVNMQPQIILLRDGTDESQGKAQLISNINACQAVAEAVRTTLGPRGMDKLIHDGQKVSGCGVVDRALRSDALSLALLELGLALLARLR